MSTTAPTRLPRWLAAFFAVLLVVTGGSLVTAPAFAAPETVTGGSLDWGVAADYRAVFATRAAGAPATLTSSDAYSFPAATTSTWSAGTQTGTLSFQGTARIGYFAGPPSPGVASGNYFYIANPVVSITGTTGTISGSTAGSSHELNPALPKAALASRTIADLDFSGVTPTISPDGTLITFTAVPTTITEAGADVLAKYTSAGDAMATRRTAGEALDPVTITLTLVEATSLTVSVPASANLGEATSLSAAVMPSDAAGSVQFFEGTTSLGSATVAAGTATTSTTLPAGVHSITAVFTPSSAARYAASTSPAASTEVRIADAEVSWPFSVYSQGWALSVSGDVIANGSVPSGKVSNGFTLTNGTGGIDPVTGAERLSFGGTASYSMYPDLAPDAKVNLSDFVLALNAGRTGGTLSADVGVGRTPTSTSQDVVIANFSIAGSKIVIEDDAFLAVSDAPAYVGALGSNPPYAGGYADTWPVGFVDAVKVGAAAYGSPTNTIASFFYKSSASAAQANKPPQPLRISYGEAITPVATTTSLSSSSATAVPGGSVTLTATVAPAAGGSIEFFEGSTSLGSAVVSAGNAQVTLNSLAMGTHTYRAVFTPNNSLSASGSTSSDTTVTVQIENASVSWPFSVYSQAWALAVSGDVVANGSVPSGKVSNGFTLTNGTGVLDPATGAGTFSFDGTASYSMYPTLAANARVNLSDFVLEIAAGQASGVVRADVSVGVTPASTAQDVVIASFTVDAAGRLATADGFKAVTDDPAYLNALASHAPYSGSYTDTWPTGFVDAIRAGANVYGGQVASIPAFFYQSGTTAAQATKPPQPLTIAYGATVATVPTTTVVSAGSVVLSLGDAATLVATVAPAVDGTVQFLDGATVLGSANVVGGAATRTVPGLTEGQHQVTAVFTPANRIANTGSTSSAVTIDVVRPTTVPTNAPAGSLQWGVKASYREYITGDIAKGSVSVSGDATASAGRYGFPQAGPSSYNTASGTGATSYRGAVRFVGHGGLIDLTISDPSVAVTSATSGVLSATVSGLGRINIGAVNLGAATRTVVDGAVIYANAPVTLTAAGVPAFERYPVGEPMDPITFTIGSASSAAANAVTSTAYQAPRQPAATPPATEGVVVDPGSLENLVAGGEITITVDGFQPNETGIMIVIYSDPVVLARDLTADANGRVTWTGRLPINLTGTHTLTVQGSVDRGVVLDIPAIATTAAVGCPVTDATLTWGFKESFRSYISGSIANGQWTLADGATYDIPHFGWSGGEGAYENGEGLVAFAGSVTFTGHGGILNTTIANPQLRFIDEDTAVILLDVSGTTQDGATVDSPSVEFVELDLTAATVAEVDGEITVTDAPSVLTPAGAEAFGTYEAGEAFDPVSFTLPLDAACGSVVPVETAEASIDAPPASAETPNLWWIWLIVALLLAAAAVVVVMIRRRNRTV